MTDISLVGPVNTANAPLGTRLPLLGDLLNWLTSFTRLGGVPLYVGSSDSGVGTVDLGADVSSPGFAILGNST